MKVWSHSDQAAFLIKVKNKSFSLLQNGQQHMESFSENLPFSIFLTQNSPQLEILSPYSAIDFAS